MPIDPDALAGLASEYAKGMTSIRGRRVQRLLKREFAGAQYVLLARAGSGEAAVKDSLPALGTATAPLASLLARARLQVPAASVPPGARPLLSKALQVPA